MSGAKRGGRAAVAAWLVLVQFASAWGPLVSPAPAFAQGTGSGDLVSRGRAFYESARFEEAIELLAGPVERRSIPASELADAREILARSYVKLGQIVKAKAVFASQLADDPSWRPDPDQVPPDEIAVFQESLIDYQRKNPSSQPKSTAGGRDDSAQGAMTPGSVSDLGESRPWWKKPWAIVGIVLAGVGIAVLAGGGGGDDGGDGGGDGDLPVPPPPPPVIGQGGR